MYQTQFSAQLRESQHIFIIFHQKIAKIIAKTTQSAKPTDYTKYYKQSYYIDSIPCYTASSFSVGTPHVAIDSIPMISLQVAVNLFINSVVSYFHQYNHAPTWCGNMNSLVFLINYRMNAKCVVQ